MVILNISINNCIPFFNTYMQALCLCYMHFVCEILAKFFSIHEDMRAYQTYYFHPPKQKSMWNNSDYFQDHNFKIVLTVSILKLKYMLLYIALTCFGQKYENIVVWNQGKT